MSVGTEEDSPESPHVDDDLIPGSKFFNNIKYDKRVHPPIFMQFGEYVYVLDIFVKFHENSKMYFFRITQPKITTEIIKIY